MGPRSGFHTGSWAHSLCAQGAEVKKGRSSAGASSPNEKQKEQLWRNCGLLVQWATLEERRQRGAGHVVPDREDCAGDGCFGGKVLGTETRC